jgi:hypothetical protein
MVGWLDEIPASVVTVMYNDDCSSSSSSSSSSSKPADHQDLYVKPCTSFWTWGYHGGDYEKLLSSGMWQRVSSAEVHRRFGWSTDSILVLEEYAI